MDFFEYRESGGKGMKKPMDRRTGRRKRWIAAIAGTMVAVCLAAAWFLRFWKPFGGTPSKDYTALAEQEGIQVVTPKIGETADYGEMDKYREKWWRSVE